jgi:hydrophobic/amphiphilic exporter-1 (mainly G- bacteria), HAE1 family
MVPLSMQSQLSPDLQTKPPGRNWNYSITKFFLNNTRLTIISFSLLLILGIASILFLKTTGFPKIEVKTALIVTVYPGASSETVNRDITIPIEGKIKGIEGIENYSSSSQNNSSVIRVSIFDSANTDTVKTKIQSAINDVKLPEGAEKPAVNSISISGADFILSISAPTLEQSYNTFETLKTKLGEVAETSEVSAITKLEKKLNVTINKEALEKTFIQPSAIATKLASLNEEIPVINNITIDAKNTGISTRIKENSLDSLKNLTFVSTPPSISGLPQQEGAQPPTPTTYKLSELATLEYGYSFDGENELVGINSNGNKSKQSLVFEITTKDGTDQAVYQKTLEEKLKEIQDVSFSPKGEFNLSDKINVVEHFTTNEQNKNQVDEVIEGLVGGPLKIQNKTLAQIGWVLGGIQLVFLVMIVFVSWRAAIVAAISIPMSLVFSTIYLFFTGGSLNTLVLFSLVLVIGLIVDPALVILESIQRKLDTGLPPKDAALEAVKDVGNGLFLATLTNIIVFVPFGVISGFLGQIFRWIPITIVPATIGSYIVPLIFLAWIGSFALKRNKSKTASEEENLWGIAKSLIRFNEWLLYGSRWVRLVFVLGILVVSILIAGYFTNSKQVRIVQFASSQNGPLISVSGSYKTETPDYQRVAIEKAIISKVLENENVLDVYPFTGTGGIFYYVNLKPVIDRPNTKSVDIAKDINNRLSDVKNELFDLEAGVEGTGGPSDAYPVALAVKTSDLDKIKSGSFDVANTLVYGTCIDADKKITVEKPTKKADGTMQSRCVDGKKSIILKVDDGFTNKQNNQLEVVLNRTQLEEKNLTIPDAPATILVNNTIKNNFNLNPRENIKIDINGEKTLVNLSYNKPQPSTAESIRTTKVTGLNGQSQSLTDIATIDQTQPKASIGRVNGQTVGLIQAKLAKDFNDEAYASQVTSGLIDYYNKDNSKETKAIGLPEKSIESYSQGGSASALKSFRDLGIALLLAIIFTYIVLAIFFNSLTQPLVILYTIPLTFTGIFPALGWLGNGEFGFLEIIGLIILVGIVENVAIFLIDAANQNLAHGMDEKRAITLASGIRFKPVILTKITAIASLAPLAFLSEFYRSISLVIIFGLLASGFVSLITTPVLYIFFRWLSREFLNLRWYNKVLFFPFMPIYVIVMGFRDKPQKLVPITSAGYGNKSGFGE